MKGKLYAMAALAGIMLAACNNQDEPTANNGSLEGTPIRVTTQVMEAETRAEMETDDLTEFYFRVTDEGGTTTDYDYFTKMTKGEDGNWTAETSEIAWKTANAQVSAVAQKTASGWEAWTKDAYDSGKEVSVLANQSSSTSTDGSISDENVKASDLLYMPATVIDPSHPTEGQISNDGKVVVNMKHAFAKLNITVNIGTAQGGGEATNPITALTVGGTKLKATFKPADATPLTEITANNPATDITARNESYTAASTTNLNAKAEAVYECIVIPQKVASNSFVVTATIAGTSYTYTHNSAITFAGNKKYTLALNLGQNTMGIDGSVTVDGFDETIDMGGGEMPPAMALTEDTKASASLSGSGTSESDPYLINNAADLKKFIDMVNTNNQSSKYFKLNADLTINTTTWAPIGNTDHYFKGNFNGNDKTIRGQLKADANNPPNNFGFFGYISYGTVKNLHMEADVTYSENSSSRFVGSIAGYCEGGSITDCTNSGSIDGGKYNATDYRENYIGGIVGFLYNGSVSDCANSGNVKGTECVQNGTSYTGGIAGAASIPSSSTAFITGCTNSGDVTGVSPAEQSSYIGGIIGLCRTDITNCTNSGDVKQAAGFGFVMGGICGSLEGDMHLCKNSGNIHKTTATSNFWKIGGLLTGDIAKNKAIYSCCTAGGTLYEADGTKSATQYIVGYDNGTNKGITEMTPCPDSHTSGN
ncbi:fimbrillin family protein [Bacteroides rodentium]